jgi:hypothetical protein
MNKKIPNWTNNQINELKKLVSQGLTYNEISDRTDRNKNSLIGKCHRLGICPNKKINKAERRDGRAKPLLKSDRAVLAQIKKHTDSWGWGLEFTEIVEFSEYPSTTVLQALKSLLCSKHINRTKSYVADHVFFNDKSVRQA